MQDQPLDNQHKQASSSTTSPEHKPKSRKASYEEPTKSKKELRTESESRVYNLATDKLIRNLMTEYKKRKNQNAMPNFAKVFVLLKLFFLCIGSSFISFSFACTFFLYENLWKIKWQIIFHVITSRLYE